MYRGGFGRGEPESFYAEEYTGVATLVYPATTRPAAAFGYVRIGDDFIAGGDFGAAARGYWAALTLLEKTFASRPQKEIIRKAAYKGLQKVSLAQGDTVRAGIMGLSAKLATTYLATEQAVRDDSLFYQEMAKWKDVELDAEKKHAALDRRQALLGVLQTLSAASQIQAAKGDVTASTAIKNQMTADMIATDREFAQQHANVDMALKAYSAKLSTLKTGMTDNAIDIGSGVARTLGEEVAFALGNARDDAPYRAVLGEFAADKPELKRAVSQRNPDRERDILAVAMAFQKYESENDINALARNRDR
jgi:hypothetical protein